ncbi:MAG: Smr/MutS family protein [Sphingomonadaceae bacterium]
MSRKGRHLTPDEADLWARVAKTVVPLEERPESPPPSGEGDRPKGGGGGFALPPRPLTNPLRQRSALPPPPRGEDRVRHGLDASWDRKLSRGISEPDFTLDLHGCSLDAAYWRLMHGLTQARAMGARLVLLVTGKERPVHAADRASQRGAIRRKVIDWLAASEHAADIAAIRGAHRKHGGQGALYVVLKKRRN